MKKRRIFILFLIAIMIAVELSNVSFVFAAEGDPVINDIIISKIFGDNSKFFINILGENLKGRTITVQNFSAEIIWRGTASEDDFVEINLEDTTKSVASIRIEGYGTINIEESQMPTVTSTNNEVKIGDPLIIKGTNLNAVKTEVDIQIPGETQLDDELTVSLDGKELSVTINGGILGLKDIIFRKQIQGDSSKPNILIVHTYREKFRLISELGIEGNLEMFPIRGEVGDKVYFKADSIPNGTSVFFLKAIDGTDKYSRTNMGQNPTPVTKDYDGRDIFTVEVPNIPKGDYYVVLTNPVGEGEDPEKTVTNTTEAGQFTVIEGRRKAKISTIEPNYGPDTGSDATITGLYLGSLNIDDLNYGEISEPEVSGIGTEELILTYDITNGEYDNKTVEKIEKRIRVIIGNKAQFKDGWLFSNDIDRLNIFVQGVGDAETDPIKDVIVETETILYDQNDTKIYSFRERAELPDGYRFIPSKITPEIISISPDKIQVVPEDPHYKVPQDMLIAIEGKNFMVYRMKDADGNIITRYPIIEIGSGIRLDKNENSDIQLIVVDDNGNIIDGSEGKESGSKILVYIPKDTQVPTSQIGKNNLKVINPIRNSNMEGLSTTKIDAIQFVVKDGDNTPIIEDVYPRTVSTKGGEEITITGSNFREGVKVYIDGKEVSNVTRSGDGRKITFIAPPGRAGKTQLVVMNPSGDSAVSDFFYLETYTDPVIIHFTPNKGSTGTLVVIKGDNFLKPDPTVLPSEVNTSTFNTAKYRLIGTRVLLGGKDINEYNQNMELKVYTPPQDNPILTTGTRADGGQYAKLGDYYHSVILEGINSFYIFELSPMGVPILTNGKGDDYYIYLENGNFVAKKSGGTDYDINVEGSILTLTNKNDDQDILTLTLKTVYTVDGDGNIVGNRVKVVDKNTIHFIVPILNEGDGWYDLAVENPDTNKDIRRGEQGFYYYSQPQSKPIITEIIPSEGSTDGGYFIEIIGGGFKDDGVSKSKVYIGGVEVPAADVQVSPDGKTIKVKVPRYEGDLKEIGTDRITVPVVVVNPDGGSTSKEDGFTYIVPRSNPLIIKIVPVKGSAAGGEIIEIFGQDFRFYEPFSDDNRNQIRDENELFIDLNGNGKHDDLRIIKQVGNTIYIEGVMGWKESIEYLKGQKGEGTTDDEAEKDLIAILPKVYFGNTPASVIEHGDGYLKVITPASKAEVIDVYVVNNDQGTSNSVKFTFESSNPTITNIVPNVGKRQGKDVVAIHGTNFIKNDNIKILGQSTDIPEALVKFGNITNKNIPRDLPNSGRIDNGRTTILLAGGLKIYYDANKEDNNLQVEIDDKGKKYTGTFTYDGSLAYLPVSLLTHEGQDYNGYELIELRVDAVERRLFVERGYSPKVTFESDTQLIVYTPSYYTIGPVPVEVINPDGATARGAFEYKNPASKPEITNITRDGQDPQEGDDQNILILPVHYQGGSIITVEGLDFRENAIIQIGDVLTINPKDIKYNLPTKLTFTMPPVSESALGRLHKVVVINEDGGTASSDKILPKPIYIQFIKGESNPAIETIFPDRGPARGGTQVTITGKDFRETMEGFEGKRIKVYFGEVQVPDEDVEVIDYKTIVVKKTPPGSPGRVEVKVENPDGSISRPSGYFIYISGPVINRVEDPLTGSKITHISVKGGQEIKLIGEQFMEGAKVIFSPVIRKASPTDTGEIINIDGEAYVLEGGVPGTNFKYIDDKTVLITTPEGKIGETGVMIINPDKGASPIYELIYDLPGIDAPEEVEAELVFDRYIRVHFSPVSGADFYEIYVLEDTTREDRAEFIGSTDSTSFLFKDIEPKTTYRFIVKAVGEFGSSESSRMSNAVKTGRNVGYSDEDGDLGEYTTIDKTGNVLNISLGYRDFDGLKVDLNKNEYKGAKEIIISIPLKVVFDANAYDTVTVFGEDFSLSFNPRVFQSSSYSKYKGEKDAGIKFRIYYNTGNTNLNSYTSLSNQLVLEGDFYRGKESQKINYLMGSMSLTMDYQKDKADLRRIDNIHMYYYDTSNWKQVSSSVNKYYGQVSGNINNLGRYAILGYRR